MARRGLCEEDRLLPTNESDRARFRYPRRQQAQAVALKAASGETVGGAFVKVYLTAQSGYFFARFIK